MIDWKLGCFPAWLVGWFVCLFIAVVYSADGPAVVVVVVVVIIVVAVVVVIVVAVVVVGCWLLVVSMAVVRYLLACLICWLVDPLLD